MAEEKKDDKKKDDKADAAKKGAAPAEGEAKGGMKSLLGPILAAVMLVAIGAGLGLWAAGLVAPPKAPAGVGGHGADAAEAKEPKDAKGAKGGSILTSATELEIGSLASNITGQGGKRYIKLQVSAWVDKVLAPKLAGGAPAVVRILKSALEEQLKSYQLADLDSPAVTRLLDKDFTEIIDRELRALFPEAKVEGRLVRKIVITEQLTQ